MKYMELNGKYPVWRCGICQEDFPPTYQGWMNSKKHATKAHGVLPKIAGVMLVNEEDGEIIEGGCSPTNTTSARKKGFYLNKDDIGSQDTPTDNPTKGELVPFEQPRGKQKQQEFRRAASASMRVVAKDIVVEDTVLLLFYEAQVKLGLGNTTEDLTQFVTECCLIAGTELELYGASLFNEAAQKYMTGGTPHGGDS